MDKATKSGSLSDNEQIAEIEIVSSPTTSSHTTTTTTTTTTTAAAAETLTKTTWLAGLCGCLAGFSYGYEPPLASGLVMNPSFLNAFFPSDVSLSSQALSPYCHTVTQELTFYTACVFLTATLISPLSGLIANKYGRRNAFLVGAWILLVANILQISAMNSAMIWAGRLILGVAMALLTTVSPMYIAEMSPADFRGRFGSGFTLSTAVGQAAAFFVNFGVGYFNNANSWRISFACGTWSTLGMLVLLHFVLPDTPSSLLYRGKIKRAESAFTRIRCINKTESNKKEWELMTEEALRATSSRSINSRPSIVNWSKIKKVFTIIPAFTIMFHLGVVRMWSGFVATMFFTSVLFKAVGSSTTWSLLAQSLVGLSTVAGSIVSILLFDRVGRRRSLVASGTLMSIAIGLAAVMLGVYLNPAPGSTLPSQAAIGLVTCLVSFQFFFYSAWGASYWVITSEVYPLSVRSAALGVGMTLSFLAVFVSVVVNSAMLCALQYGTFILFACISAYLTLFSYGLLLETKGLKLQEIENLWRRHPIWSKFVPRNDSLMRSDNDHSDDDHMLTTVSSGILL